ncbi:hypothetical protein FGADI_6521 [Fusarium gaditjirri]|uniref:Heterokaryon incompatibility domain-containing protein n=1 Tax=Fusarium gaditjirri TaxID=282569 RepID=A0A8H4T7L5_9HYPO|nr:hypothetical protein FGADI_6521 [Fusarium gaditjirri]
MADPLSMIATIGALVSTSVTTSPQATEFKHSFSGAPAAVQGLRCPRILEGGGNGATPGLKGSLDVLIDGIHSSINEVGYELTLVGSSLDISSVNLGGGMSKRERARFVWKEDVFKELMLDIREQRSSLAFLLDCVNTPRITVILPGILDCPGVLKEVAKLRLPPVHHQTYQSLEQAIDAGCYICNRFWEALSAQEHVLLSSTLSKGVEPSGAYCAPESVQHYLTSISLDGGKSYGHPGCYLLQVAYNKPATTTCFIASFLLEPVERQWLHTSLRIISKANHTVGATTNLGRQNLAQSTQSPKTLSLAKDWVRECNAHHERCKKPVGEKPWYPTRLLSFDLPEASIVRLLETDQTTPVGQYMTLTHRWGPVDHIILTKETYPQLLEGLPLSTLPQLFRDAISICSHLGVGYIWIDSLCIFQGKDNIRDWQCEASLMMNVYSNSFCNISAADTPNCTQSMFNSRDPGLLNPQVVELTLCGEGSAKITKRFVLSDYRFWESEVSNALVNKRGWVLQERFLAPRILHFSKRQLIWECCEKDAAEVYPNGLPLALSTSSDARFKQMDSSDYIGRVDRYSYREADGNSAPHLLWLRIVELYTASALTVPSDKLIACSGIAKRVAEIVQDDYVAGMWRRYLEGELLWVVQGNHQPGRWTRPTKYRAPSWSWASIDGPVTPGEPRIQDSLITVEDYHLDYWTSDETAAIRGGWLRLRGVLKKTTLVRKSSTLSGGYHWDMMLNNERVNVLEEASPGNIEPRVMLDILQEDFEEENAKGLLFSMCSRSKNGDGRGMYILLFKMVEGETGTFRRIGLAYAWKHVKA